MTVLARRIRSTPFRTATETWHLITDLVAAKSETAHRELLAFQGVAASVIADEGPRDAPVVVTGSGPRLRIYCLYGDDAIGGETASEEALTWDPTDAAWQVLLPVAADELAWVSASLEKIGSRVLAYDPAADERAAETSSRKAVFRVDLEEFKRS